MALIIVVIRLIRLIRVPIKVIRVPILDPCSRQNKKSPKRGFLYLMMYGIGRLYGYPFNQPES
jgi:hypothetical protein